MEIKFHLRETKLWCAAQKAISTSQKASPESEELGEVGDEVLGEGGREGGKGTVG
jgi:NTP pyrophosphatase (non-canonical NTP hydrolase)